MYCVVAMKLTVRENYRSLTLRVTTLDLAMNQASIGVSVRFTCIHPSIVCQYVSFLQRLNRSLLACPIASEPLSIMQLGVSDNPLPLYARYLYAQARPLVQTICNLLRSVITITALLITDSRPAFLQSWIEARTLRYLNSVDLSFAC